MHRMLCHNDNCMPMLFIVELAEAASTEYRLYRYVYSVSRSFRSSFDRYGRT